MIVRNYLVDKCPNLYKYTLLRLPPFHIECEGAGNKREGEGSGEEDKKCVGDWKEEGSKILVGEW